MPIEEIGGNRVIIATEDPPEHLRDEVPNATGAGRRHYFCHLPHLRVQLCSVKVLILGPWPLKRIILSVLSSDMLTIADFDGFVSCAVHVL